MGTIGRFGEYGGQYIPETLMNAVQELEAAYREASGETDPAWEQTAADGLNDEAW